MIHQPCLIDKDPDHLKIEVLTEVFAEDKCAMKKTLSGFGEKKICKMGRDCHYEILIFLRQNDIFKMQIFVIVCLFLLLMDD